jgi:periplasmic divalent cation tolerance protein
MLIILVTTANFVEAASIARVLVGRNLAACVQILPRITSVYRWKGEVQEDPEHLLLIKTLDEHFAEIERAVRENHSYETPEIVAVSADRFSASYLAWMNDVLGGNG